MRKKCEIYSVIKKSLKSNKTCVVSLTSDDFGAIRRPCFHQRKPFLKNQSAIASILGAFRLSQIERIHRADRVLCAGN